MNGTPSFHMHPENTERQETNDFTETRIRLTNAILQSPDVPANERDELLEMSLSLPEDMLEDAVNLSETDMRSLIGAIRFFGKMKRIDRALREFESQVQWLRWSAHRAAKKSEGIENLAQARTAEEELRYIA